MTDDELAALRAAAEAASAGAWTYRAAPFSAPHTYLSAANPAAILRLLAHVEALTAQRDMLMSVRDDMAERLLAKAKQVAERDSLLREAADNDDTRIRLVCRIDALLGGER